jgi:hypothetical protein
MKLSEAVRKTLRMAFGFVLVASIRSSPWDHVARVIWTVSVLGGPDAGTTPIVPVAVWPSQLAVTVMVRLAETAVVVTGKAPLDAPPFTTISWGTLTTAGSLLESETVAPSVTVSNRTVPVAGLPPPTVVGLNVTDDSVGGAGG